MRKTTYTVIPNMSTIMEAMSTGVRCNLVHQPPFLYLEFGGELFEATRAFVEGDWIFAIILDVDDNWKVSRYGYANIAEMHTSESGVNG